MTNQEATDIKVSINNLFVQTGILSVKQSILESMTLGVFKETLSPDQYRNVYTNYVNLLEKALNEAVNNVETLLFEVEDPAFLIRQRFDVTSLISSMKSNEDYISDSEQ